MFCAELYGEFNKFGNIAKVEILEAKNDFVPRVAIIMFNPPPREPFWQRDRIESASSPAYFTAELQDPAEMALKLRKPIQKLYENIVTCPVNRLDFAFEYKPNHLVVKRSIFNSDPQSLRLTVNTDRHEIVAYFSIDNVFLEADTDELPAPPADQASSTSSGSADVATHEFKFHIPFKQLQHIGVRNKAQKHVELFISLPTSIVPRFFKKMDPSTTFEEGEIYWTQNKAWLRRTTVCSNAFGKFQRHTPLRLNEPEPYINIGSLTTYCFCIEKSTFAIIGVQALKALSDHNQNFDNAYDPRVTFSGRSDSAMSSAPFWNALDADLSRQASPATVLANLDSNPYLLWSVRYQLEVCISKGLLNPTNLTASFIAKLKSKSERRAVKLLEHVADKGKRFFEPEHIFSLHPPKTPSSSKVHANHILQRSVTVKPSSMEYLTPSVDESNRIIRRFSKFADRFIRVNFRDEKGEGKIFSDDSEVNVALFNRVMRTLNHGIRIGDRDYVWLASGNSQFREHGVYFFAETPEISAQQIRTQMGNFRDMHYVAKLNARMGQCFSTTREFDGNPQVEETQDVEITGSNGTICFTDGVGKMSMFLKDMVNDQMKFRNGPSAFQFRMGGIKGVLACWPDLKGMRIVTRPSQNKFSAERAKLEIIRPALYVCPELNRQLITILACLGVKEEIFMKRLEKMLVDINDAMHDAEKASHLLRKRVDVNSMTLTIRNMVVTGFMEADEPFVQALLMLWRAWSHKKLKEKAGIQIDKGAFVMGVTDETKTLRGPVNAAVAAQNNASKDIFDSLPQIFLQVPNRRDPTSLRVVKGVCVLARNPSLHPGDIRIVQAVDNPHLRHLRNVVVFPQTGDTDIPSMCSGGDLDGDDYFITWDKELIPPVEEWNHEAMQHKAAVPEWRENITEEDLKVFFVNHMKQDSLGKIANAWLAQADQLEGGPKTRVCKSLAELHSTAVDFPKTGVPASGKLFKRFQPRLYPHFLESNRPRHKIYTSASVVGQLYDRVERVPYSPLLHKPFDHRVLRFHQRDEELERVVRVLKNGYDAALRRIMAQFEIENEAEIWTGFVLQHGKGLKEYELQSKIGNLVNGQKDKYREVCIEKAGGREAHRLYPFVAAMYWVTSEQVTGEMRQITETYGYASVTDVHLAPSERPMMSFPWLFDHELGQMAKNRIALPEAGVITHPWDGAQGAHPAAVTLLDADDQGGVTDFHFGEGAHPDDATALSSTTLLPVPGFLDSDSANPHSHSLLDQDDLQQLNTQGQQRIPSEQHKPATLIPETSSTAPSNDAEAQLLIDFAAPDFPLNPPATLSADDPFLGITKPMDDPYGAQSTFEPSLCPVHASQRAGLISPADTVATSPEHADGVIDHRLVDESSPSAVVNGHNNPSHYPSNSGHDAVQSPAADDTVVQSDDNDEVDDEEMEISPSPNPLSRLATLMSAQGDKSHDDDDNESVSH
ncbi:MAG: hypothetical protein Q9162_003505 [Coniocarpon cinnabarinum]